MIIKAIRRITSPCSLSLVLSDAVPTYSEYVYLNRSMELQYFLRRNFNQIIFSNCYLPCRDRVRYYDDAVVHLPRGLFILMSLHLENSCLPSQWSFIFILNFCIGERVLIVSDVEFNLNLL